MPLDHRDYMRAGPTRSSPGWLPDWNAFQWVFAANVAVFLLQWLFQVGWLEDPLSGRSIMPMGGVSLDELTRGHVWTLGTYMFVHGSPGHVLVNLLFLWFAGRRVHELFGGRNFLMIHFLSGLAGAILQMAVGSLVQGDTSSPLIGASACCMGHMLACAMAAPREQITLLLFFIVPIRVTMRGLGRFLLLSNLGLGILDVLGVLPGWLAGSSAVAYWAHVGGALAGWFGAQSAGLAGGAFSSLARPFPRRRTIGVESHRHQNRGSVSGPASMPEEETTSNRMSEEIDAILDKISARGMDSLSEQERRVLERASRRMSGVG